MNARRIGRALMLVILGAASAAMAETFQDGGYHQINYTLDYTIVRDNFWGDPTTLELVHPGYIDGHLYVYDTSRAVIAGGYVRTWAEAFDYSELIISGGEVGGVVTAHPDSHVTISGGRLYSSIMAYGHVTVEAGQIDSYINAVGPDSQVDISGGSVAQVVQAAGANSRVNISGGSLEDVRGIDSGWMTLSGGTVGGSCIFSDHSRLTVEGYGFAIDGVPVGYGTYDTGGQPDRYGFLLGTLASGEAIGNNFELHDNATLTLVPEPAMLSLLALGGLALIRRRR